MRIETKSLEETRDYLLPIAENASDLVSGITTFLRTKSVLSDSSATELERMRAEKIQAFALEAMKQHRRKLQRAMPGIDLTGVIELERPLVAVSQGEGGQIPTELPT